MPYSWPNWSRNCNSERMQAILQYVGVGSVIMMGLAATVSLFRDMSRPTPEAFCKHKFREMKDQIDGNIQHGRDR
ncbi:hypothetical protein [Limnoglobus roseus]|uniref:hypothetical protein n=1 Tax=Limnoglobus roseus TaxID=2598579 RepID=UPI0011EABB08|nr:hypothetical protein [Limnoglobus roseus]